MKILFYINSLNTGGAERAIANTASYFAEHGWDTILLTSFRLENEYDYSNKVRRMSIENEQIAQSRLKRNLSRIWVLRKICKEEKVDIIVSFMAEPNFRALLATIGLKTRNVISVRTDPELEYAGKIGRIIGKYLLQLADGAVFQTSDAKAWFPKQLQQCSAIIYNVVDDRFFQTTYRDGNDIVTCGRIDPLKNHELLVRAFRKVLDDFPDERLVIYGAVGENMVIQELIEELDLREHVFLPGKSDDIPMVLANAKLFVLSSDHEGLPNALMEAMAVGVPSISTDCPCGGPRELFGDDLADMLTPVGDVNALAEKMTELLADNKRRLEVGRKMKIRARIFRTDEIGNKWLQYLEEVCVRY